MDHRSTRLGTSRRGVLCTLCAGLALGPAAWAADDAYPTKPVRIIVPFAPGGAGDAVTRIVASQLGTRLGQTVIVDNRPGAGGATGAGAVIKSPPDGYTIAFVSSGYAMLAAMNPKLPFDTTKDLLPIAQIGSVPYVFLTRLDAPYKTVPEFIAYAKAHPGKIAFASAGVGTLTHLVPAWISAEAGISLNHIPYGGTAPAMNSLVAGQTDVYFDPVSTSMPQLDAQRVRAMATTGTKRAASLPDVPTLNELGFKARGATWFGLMAPVGTPQSVIEKLHREVNQVLASDETKRRLADLHFDIEPRSITEFGDFVQSEIRTWGRIVRDNGIKGD